MHSQLNDWHLLFISVNIWSIDGERPSLYDYPVVVYTFCDRVMQGHDKSGDALFHVETGFHIFVVRAMGVKAIMSSFSVHPMSGSWWRHQMERFSAATGPLWGESTGHRWIPLTKASDAELWCFLWPAPEQTVEQTTKTPVICDATTLIMTSL